MLGLVLISALGVHLERAIDMPVSEAVPIVDRLRDEIERRTQQDVVIDSPDWAPCQSADRCVDVIRARTGADDLLLVRVIQGPTRIRIVAERLAPGQPPRQGKADLSRAASGLDTPLAELVGALYERARPALTAGAPVEAVPPGPSMWPSLILFAAAGGAAGTGALFGLSSRQSADTLGETILSPEEDDDRRGSIRTRALAANVLFAAAGAAAITAIVLLLR